MSAAEISTTASRLIAEIVNSAALNQLRESVESAQRLGREAQEQAEVRHFRQQLLTFQERWARQVEEARRVEQATRALDSSRRARLRRVIVTWDNQVQAQQVLGARSEEDSWSAYRSFWDTSAVAPACPDLTEYLEAAHHHPAIARQKHGGVRGWFDSWREVVLLAMRAGVGSDEVVTIVQSLPVGKKRFRRRSPVKAITLAFNWLRERFISIFHPNPPNSLLFLRRPVSGGELSAVRA